MIILETDRLTIEEITLQDGQFIVELMNTKGWLEFIGDREIDSLQKAHAYIKDKFIWAYKEWGYGPYKIVLKESQTPIGILTFVKRDYLEFLDIGFAVLPKFEGKGYMKEASLSGLNYALSELNQQNVFAFTEVNNVRSIKLLESIGLVQDGMITPERDTEELLFYTTK
jgi:RimJ/RimL family protein N-acetyltransferase